MRSAGGGSINQIQDRIIHEMSGLNDPLDKYAYLVGLGREFQGTDDGIRSDAYAIPGCQSRVWIRSEMRDGRLRLTADSDAMITRGIIALLVRVLDDHPPEEIVDADLYFLDRTGLRTHLSPFRANGLATMVRQIRSYAEVQALRARVGEKPAGTKKGPPEKAGGPFFQAGR